MVVSPNNAILGFPMIRRLMEYSAIIVSIEASRFKIPSLVFMYAVTIPASMPAKKAANVDNQGSTPDTIITAVTAAPKGKLPSTVRSGNSKMRKERKTPNATKANTRPLSSAPRAAIVDIKTYFDAVSTTSLADLISSSDNVTPIAFASLFVSLL